MYIVKIKNLSDAFECTTLECIESEGEVISFCFIFRSFRVFIIKENGALPRSLKTRESSRYFGRIDDEISVS